MSGYPQSALAIAILLFCPSERLFVAVIMVLSFIERHYNSFSSNASLQTLLSIFLLSGRPIRIFDRMLCCLNHNFCDIQPIFPLILTDPRRIVTLPSSILMNVVLPLSGNPKMMSLLPRVKFREMLLKLNSLQLNGFLMGFGVLSLNSLAILKSNRSYYVFSSWLFLLLSSSSMLDSIYLFLKCSRDSSVSQLITTLSMMT